MDHYISEQEQVEQLKRWWKDNGKSLLLGLVIGIGGLAGYRYWDSTQSARAENASINYEHLLQMASNQQDDEAVSTGRAIIEAYPDSTYAKLTTLLLAKLAVEKGDYAQAKAQLQSLLVDDDKGEIAHVARARLARILLAEGAADEADKLVGAIPPVDGKSRYPELRGDILAARGDVAGARTMYLQALVEAGELGVQSESVQLKLDNLPADGS